MTNDQAIALIDEILGQALALKAVFMRRRGAGPSVPDQVLGLTATPVSSSQISLAWNAAATAQTYTVRRDGQQIANLVPGTTYPDIGLSASTLYRYTVAAVNTFGEGLASAIVSATTQAGTNVFPPTAPTITNLTATGTADPTTTLRATHTAVTNTDHYAVQKRVTGGSTWTRLGTLDHTGTSIDITGNLPGQSVDVQIAACDASESVVLWSATATASTQGTTTVGSGLLAVAYGNQGSYGQTGVINWLGMMDVAFLESFEGSGAVYGPNFTTWSAVVNGVYAARRALGYSSDNDVINYYNALIGGNSTLVTLLNKLQANQTWLLRATSPSGTLMTWAGFPQATNFYPGAATSGGLTIQQWIALYYDNIGRTGNASGVLTGGSNNNAAPIKGYFSDDNNLQFPLTADYARTGSATPRNSTTNANYMAAQVAIITALKNLFPAAKVWINGQGNYGSLSSIPQYQGITNGGCFLENSLGDANTYEGSRGPTFSGLLTAIRQTQALAATANNVWCLSHNSVGANGQDATSATNAAAYQAETFQSMRHAYCIAKAYGGFYACNANATGAEYNPVNSSTRYLDEYSWNPTTGVCTGSAGKTATSLGARGNSQVGFNPTVLANGVIRSDYDNCVFLVNPLENGAKNNFQLGGSSNLHFLSGTQSASVNTGGLVTPTTPISMPARSGRVLRRG